MNSKGVPSGHFKPFWNKILPDFFPKNHNDSLFIIRYSLAAYAAKVSFISVEMLNKADKHIFYYLGTVENKANSMLTVCRGSIKMHVFQVIPLLILTLPRTKTGLLIWAFFFAAYLAIAVRVRKSASGLEKRQGNLLQYAAALVLSGFLSALFFVRWYNTGVFVRMLSRIHVPFLPVLAIGTVGLFFASFFSLCGLLRLLPAFPGIPALWEAPSPKEAARLSPAAAGLLAALLTLVFWLFQGKQSLWVNMDDFFISNVLNSRFAEENYCFFVSPVFTRLVPWLSRVFPSADGYVLVGELLSLLSLWTVLYLCIRRFSLTGVLAVWLSLLAFSAKLNLLHSPFTVMAGELAVVGFLACLSYAAGYCGAVTGGIGIFLSAAAYLYRLEGALLPIPFLILILIAKYFSTDANLRKDLGKRLIVFLPAIILISGQLFVKYQTDYSAKYRNGVECSNLRASIVDYPMRPEALFSEALSAAGYTENDSVSAKIMLLADTDTANRAFLQDIADITGQTVSDKILVFRTEGLSRIWKCITQQKAQLVQICILGILTLPVLLSDENIWKKTAVFLSLSGMIAMFGAFALLGRTVAYVNQTIILGAWCVVFYAWLDGVPPIRKKILSRLTIVAAAVSIALSMRQQPDRAWNPVSVLSARDGQVTDIAAFQDTEDTVYIWGVYDYLTGLKKSDFIKNNHLLTEDFLAHNLVDGDWMYFQPYYLDYLEAIGFQNPLQSLISRENTFYICEENRCRRMLTFINEHYSEDYTAERVGTAMGIPIWVFSRS